MKIFFSVFVFVLTQLTLGNALEKSIIGADGTGFFVNYCRALNHLYHCKLNNKTPVVYWNSDSSYYDPNGYNNSYNGWEYYFYPVSDMSYESGDFIERRSYSDNFSVLWDYHQYIGNIHLCNKQDQETFINILNAEFNNCWSGPVNGLHIYDKVFRRYVKEELINPYIKIKESVQEKIENFYIKEILGKKTIGVHLRGQHLFGHLPYVPVEKILEIANSLADEDTQFYIATDQTDLIKLAQKILKGKVVFYEIERFAITTSPYPDGGKLHPKLGEDVLIEATLLSKCDFLIHTISTVSTAVLYMNPELNHVVLY